MKKIVNFITLVFSVCLLSVSCNEDFLEKAPGVDLTEDDIFKNQKGVENFIPTIYRYAIPSMFEYPSFHDKNLSYTRPVGESDWVVVLPSGTMCDEGEESDIDYGAGDNWNTGDVTPQNIHRSGDNRYFARWISLRQINTVLKRIDEVPDADENYKKQIIGEMKVLRAINYLEMIKRYGGVPIVKEVFQPGVQIDAPRKSIEECVDFIVSECDEAVSLLPPSYNSSQTGRVTSVVAKVIKAEALLFAASPIFNTATPYMSMPNTEDNNLICYGNYDINRWKLAADAYREALNLAEANGYRLIDNPANRDPKDVPGSGEPGPDGNYRYSWETNNNSEIILAFQESVQRQWRRPLNNMMPQVFGGWVAGNTVPLNFYRKYEKKDGTPQAWDMDGGDDLVAKFEELDPRFKQTLNFTSAYYNDAHPIAEIYEGGRHYRNCFGGVWMRKYVPRASSWQYIVLNDVIYRVNELYLGYAEALNEFASTPPEEAYEAVNTIRNRSAMPNLPAGLTKEQFRERLRNEKAIEMAFDDHRFFDIRRWLIAEEEGVMKGNFYGLRINKEDDGKYSWKPYIFETRTFKRRMYLHPFPNEEVLKGNLIQNPGY